VYTALSKYIKFAILMRNEQFGPDKLAELQARKLRRLIAHAFENVPFYSRLFRESGVTPEDIRVPRRP
jgi:phenylacetate-CoA ligase